MFFQGLETKRLILKNIGPEDDGFMYTEFSNEDVNQFLYDAEPMSSVEEAMGWIDLFTQPEPRNQHRWILVLKENGEKIGTCGFHCWNREEGIAEIGYDLLPDYWKQGYMSEAMEAMMQFARDQMKLTKVVANIAEHNIASEKTAEKFGFTRSNNYYEIFHEQKYLHYIYEKIL